MLDFRVGTGCQDPRKQASGRLLLGREPGNRLELADVPGKNKERLVLPFREMDIPEACPRRCNVLRREEFLHDMYALR
jgi:hypothetical protein